MEQITSRQNPLIARLRKLGGDRSLRRREGVFLCEGVKLAEEAVRWGAEIEVLVRARNFTLPFAPPGAGQTGGGARRPASGGVHGRRAPGVLCLCRMPPLAPPERLEPGRYLVLDGLQDPGNVGTVWRTADAFGAAGLFLIDGCADPFSPKTIRSTMGACFRLPVWETGWERLKPLLDAAGIPLYATALRSDTEDVRGAALGRAAVIIGSEGRGVSRQALEMCEKTLKIPMRERCESLNAAAAAAVVLWEGWR